MLHLDHIIILVPYASLETPPSWINDNFTISPGGQHADGKTENRLICFRDGSYIELIAFVDNDPRNREGHWWGSKKFGIIDFALMDSSGDADKQYEEMRARLRELEKRDGMRVWYEKPVEGGRKRPDGVDVKWKVTFPVLNEGRQRGEFPFFCHDVTDRSLRVPLEDKNVNHPCGAYGIRSIQIHLAPARSASGLKTYPAILEASNELSDSPPGKEECYTLARLWPIDGALDPMFWVKKAVGEDILGAVKDRGGVYIHSLMIGCSGGKEGIRQIDVGDDSIGGVFLGTD